MHELPSPTPVARSVIVLTALLQGLLPVFQGFGMGGDHTAHTVLPDGGQGLIMPCLQPILLAWLLPSR